jgi:ketosteroid isomerase-like protein
MSNKSRWPWILVLSAAGLLGLSAVHDGGQARSEAAPTGNDGEIEAVTRAINNVFGWAATKDFDLFFQTLADDSNFVAVTPFQKVKFGIEAVKNDTAFWASPNFKAIRHELRDLRITFSRSGDVAWFYCVLDDINEWKGQPANWENVRWTGVLEKRLGKWRVVQHHLSFPKE